MVHESQFLNQPVEPGRTQTPNLYKPILKGESFASVLKKTEAPDVKFSAHASERLAQREISLSDSDLSAIASAADKAATKGSRESLFLLNNLGLIVNVKNRTVLTAIDPGRMRDGIVTNIDSTVIIGK